MNTFLKLIQVFENTDDKTGEVTYSLGPILLPVGRITRVYCYGPDAGAIHAAGGRTCIEYHDHTREWEIDVVQSIEYIAEKIGAI